MPQGQQYLQYNFLSVFRNAVGMSECRIIQAEISRQTLCSPQFHLQRADHISTGLRLVPPCLPAQLRVSSWRQAVINHSLHYHCSLI
ncbi:hypothetical protein R3I94_007564 [Phoxinus phoxinus]